MRFLVPNYLTESGQVALNRAVCRAEWVCEIIFLISLSNPKEKNCIPISILVPIKYKLNRRKCPFAYNQTF